MTPNTRKRHKAAMPLVFVNHIIWGTRTPDSVEELDQVLAEFIKEAEQIMAIGIPDFAKRCSGDHMIELETLRGLSIGK